MFFAFSLHKVLRKTDVVKHNMENQVLCLVDVIFLSNLKYLDEVTKLVYSNEIHYKCVLFLSVVKYILKLTFPISCTIEKDMQTY